MLIANEGVGRLTAEVEVDAANGQVHRRQAPSRRIGLLAIDRDIAELATVDFDEFFRLDKHTAGAAARIVDLAMVRIQYRDQGFDDAGRGVELPALFTFGTGELAEEVFIDLAEQVAGLMGVATEADS
ncbi:hypothetical protein D3C84_460350 [compost metagenome]